jgi:transcriptional regulator with XRE-family HTH domain
MAILRERETWSRKRAARETEQPDDLTPEEGENVRAVLRALHHQYRRWDKLAKAMGVKTQTLKQAANRKRRRPTAGFALRAARLAKCPVEMVLSGVVLESYSCGMCGQLLRTFNRARCSWVFDHRRTK